MLDLLLQRQQDAPLWADADLAYIVIDEFHTYNGAQGTDVTMLLRRLGVVVGAAEEGRPLGSICPVATSATLGESPVRDRQDQGGAGGSRAMLNVASQVFGMRFPDDAVVGEDRRDLNSFLSPVDVWLPLPSPAQVAALPDPPARDGGLDEVSRLVLGCDTSDAREMGRRLLAHPLTHDLLTADVDQPLTAGEILAAFPAGSAWRVTAAQDPEIAAEALARFIALISVARDPGSPAGKDRPLLLVETHLWVRALSRVLRFVAPQPAFSWTDADRAASASVASAAQADRNRVVPRAGRLPSAYCRHCGRSGWSAVCPERNPTSLVSAPDDVYRLSVGGGAGKARVRALIAATPAEAANQARQALGRSMRRGKRAAVREATVLVLEDNGEALRRIDPDEVLRPDGSIAEAPENGVFVKAWFDNADQDAYAKQDRCPACGQAQGIRFLGAGVAPLASVAVTQLFTGGELPKKDADGNNARKTLIFNDSVQDAAHRAGFVASRAWKFSLRSLVQEQLAQRSAEEPDFADEGVPLNELIAALVKRASVDKEKLLASVVPPDLHDVDKVKRLLAGKKRLPKGTWELVGERLAFNTLLEFGLNSRAGRTLELTRTVAAEVYLPDPTTAAELAEGLHREHLRRQLPVDPEEAAEDDGPAGESAPPVLPASGPERLRRFEGFVRGLLEHVRTSGGIRHQWLDEFINAEGRNRYLVWGGRPEGMQAFGRHSDAPAFVLVGSRSGRTDFERVDTKESWYADFTARCLGMDRALAAGYLAELLPRLADPEIGALAHRRTGQEAAGRGNQDHGTYGLAPGHIRVRPLTDEQTAHAALACPECGWTQTVPPERVPVWQGLPCPLKGCEGQLAVPSTEAPGRAGGRLPGRLPVARLRGDEPDRGGRRQAGPAPGRWHAGLADHLGQRHGLGQGAAEPGRPPYAVDGDATPGGRARANWARQRQDPAEIDRLFAGAVPALLAFLADPDLRRWHALARLCVGGLLPLAKREEVVDASPEAAVAWIEATLRGDARPPVSGQGLKLYPVRDGSGLPLTLIGDGRTKPQGLSALAVLDDRAEAVAGDGDTHRRRWKAWLCWGNVLQFLDPAGTGRADGLQLARSELDPFDAGLLAATAVRAGGLLPALREELPGTGLVLPEAEREDPGAAPEAAAEAAPGTSPQADGARAVPTELERAAWDFVLRELSYVGDPAIEALATALAERGQVRAAEAGWDAPGLFRPLELAWPDRRIAVVLDEDAADDAYMEQCHAAGWQVRAPGGWDKKELAALLDDRRESASGEGGDGFEAWRLFLHPEQRRLATTSFKGSAKVTGGPGTGKTVVALHRVRHLVDRLPRAGPGPCC